MDAPSRRTSPAIQGLTPLEVAVLRTVTYVDIYDYPLTSKEIHRYLFGVSATGPKVENVLENGLLVQNHLALTDGYFTLPGRRAIVETRRRRSAIAKELWPLAIRYGYVIAKIPFVRMVGVTGSLAVDNADRDGDIDYLIVTENGHLWVSRAMVILVVRHAAQRQVALCPNYFLTEQAMSLEERNLYTAREVAQLVPLYGLDIYFQMRQLNEWVTDFLPNAKGMPPVPAGLDQGLDISKYRSFKLAETALRTRLGIWLENWEMKRKIRRFSMQSVDNEPSFSADWCKGHFDGHRRKALEEFETHWHEFEQNQWH
jgi:hypothetical protein